LIDKLIARLARAYKNRYQVGAKAAKSLPTPWDLLSDYARHTTLAVGFFVLLVLSTALLFYCAEWLKPCPFHHLLATYIERYIFVLASSVLVWVQLTETIKTLHGVTKRFFESLKHHESSI